MQLTWNLHSIKLSCSCSLTYCAIWRKSYNSRKSKFQNWDSFRFRCSDSILSVKGSRYVKSDCDVLCRESTEDSKNGIRSLALFVLEIWAIKHTHFSVFLGPILQNQMRFSAKWAQYQDLMSRFKLTIK